MAPTSDPDDRTPTDDTPDGRSRFDSGKEPQPDSDERVKAAAEEAERMGGDDVHGSDAPG